MRVDRLMEPNGFAFIEGNKTVEFLWNQNYKAWDLRATELDTRAILLFPSGVTIPKDVHELYFRLRSDRVLYVSYDMHSGGDGNEYGEDWIAALIELKPEDSDDAAPVDIIGDLLLFPEGRFNWDAHSRVD